MFLRYGCQEISSLTRVTKMQNEVWNQNIQCFEQHLKKVLRGSQKSFWN